jgi:hypothetical protein
LIREESLEDALRWRAGRIADEGFLQKEEAIELLNSQASRHKNIKKWILESRELAQKRAAVQAKQKSFHAPLPQSVSMEFPEMFEHIHTMLCKMPPQEGVRYIAQATGSAGISKLIGSNHNIPTEQFYTDEDFLNEASEEILGACQSLLIQHDFSAQTERSAQLLIEHALIQYGERESSRFVELKSHIARIANMVFSATSSFSYNETEILHCLLTVRGAINVGLEALLSLPEEYHLVRKKTNDIDQCVDFINELGMDTIFYLGWESIKTVETQIKKTLKIISGDAISQGLDHENTIKNEPAIQTVCNAINRFVPLYPLCLGMPNEPLPAIDGPLSQETKPIETQDELEKIKKFINNLEFMSHSSLHKEF